MPGLNEIFVPLSLLVLLSFPMLWLFNLLMYGDVFWQQLVHIVAVLETIDPVFKVEPAPRMAGDGNTHYNDYNQMVEDFWEGFMVTADIVTTPLSPCRNMF